MQSFIPDELAQTIFEDYSASRTVNHSGCIRALPFPSLDSFRAPVIGFADDGR